jgi:hypothetical protein
MAARTTARYLSLTAICHIRLQEIFHHSRRHVTEFANNLYYKVCDGTSDRDICGVPSKGVRRYEKYVGRHAMEHPEFSQYPTNQVRIIHVALLDTHSLSTTDSSTADIFTGRNDISHRSVMRKVCFSVVNADHSQHPGHSCGRRLIDIDT